MIAIFDFMLRRADSTWRDKSWRRQASDTFTAKDTRFVADWLQSKGLHKLFSVFEGIQEPFVLSSVCRSVVYKPCLHTQLPEHNKSYQKVSWGWGHLITWNEPMVGHLNSFSAWGGGNLNKNFPKFQMPGVCPGEC